MKVLDFYRKEVLHFYRPLRCLGCCFPCCPQELEVSAPPGNVIGSVLEEGSCCKPVFSIRDATGVTVLRIEGPLAPDFKVLTVDGDQVGKISKQWTGLVREIFTDADHFGINFSLDLDVKTKATLLGAVFLIDYMYFEQNI